MKPITSSEFFKSWLKVVNSKKNELLKVWNKAKDYTAAILGNEDSVICEIAKDLNLNAYPKDYYSIDAILYKEEDRVPEIPKEYYWFRAIRIAFEHENDFNSGLYQEVSHLLITKCDLRVLVSYPNGEIDSQLDYLHKIIKGTDSAKELSAKENFLIIFGYENGFQWEGFVFKLDSWKRI